MPPCKPRKAGNVPQIFVNKIFALHGNFADPQYTHENVTRWIKARGGQVSTDIDNQTDFLVCTIEEYRVDPRPPIVSAARSRAATCKIVTADFLEACFALKRGHKRLPPTRDYELSRLNAAGARSQKDSSFNYAAGGNRFKGLADPTRYHIYTDETNFVMEVKLVKTDIAIWKKGVRNNLQDTYSLYLFESNAKPHTYMFGAKFYRSGRAVFDTNHCVDSDFDTALRAFKVFFVIKTKVEWDNRQDDLGGYPNWVYEQPQAGKPRGVMPSGRVSLDEREPKDEATLEQIVAKENAAELKAVLERTNIPDDVSASLGGGTTERASVGLLSPASIESESGTATGKLAYCVENVEGRPRRVLLID